MLSGSETAITSIPKQKVHQLDDTRKNNRIKRAKENIEKTIGGILVGNNFVNILMASVATLIFVRRFGESAGSAIATIFTTVIVLIFGDITPKTLATKLPIVFLSRTTFLVELLSRVFAPFTEAITKVIMKFVRTSDEDDAEVTEADIQALTALGEIEGQILPAEREIIDSLLDFSDRPIKEIMTPRVDVLFLSIPINIVDVKGLVNDKRISRMPVSKSESLDDTFGIVYVKDLFNLKANSDSVEIENLVKDVIYLPEYTTVLSALNILRENKSSFACVIDENGGIEGVITIKDVLSEFVGDLPDEHDQRFLGINRLGPGQWTIEGKTDIDDFEEFFGLEPNDKDVATVGGLFLSHSEQLPSKGEKITIDGLEITITEMDNRRIESVTVKKISRK
jgi:CBS domain containing-hemolysin-like protein|tara:strand:+ start:645 stop:1829 length:1185 start_codon:yes stop_codon:yes gene_type:complete